MPLRLLFVAKWSQRHRRGAARRYDDGQRRACGQQAKPHRSCRPVRYRRQIHAPHENEPINGSLQRADAAGQRRLDLDQRHARCSPQRFRRKARWRKSMRSLKLALAASFAIASLAGAGSRANAAPLPTHVATMKSMLAGNTVEVRWGWGGGWRGGGWGGRGWGGGGWGYRGFGRRGLGWGAAAAGAVIGGALVSGAYYGGSPYYSTGGYYSAPSYGYGGYGGYGAYGGGYGYESCSPYGSYGQRYYGW
jgi:hypothetical protein